MTGRQDDKFVNSGDFSCLEELWAWVESTIPAERSIRQNNAMAKERSEQRAAQFRLLCRELGRPQQCFRSVHVAGSKGKGQTAACIAHGLAASGYRVGLFSSPHLHSYSERIQVLERHPVGEVFSRADTACLLPGSLRSLGPVGLRSAAENHNADWYIRARNIAETLREQGSLLRRDLARLCRTNEPAEAGNKSCLQPNFFALLTLLAFRGFAALDCDWAVLETGMGGRLCPTNTVLPELSVLTPIELEHTEVLGERLELIAAEKAAIIKKGRPCVSSRQHPEARAVLRDFSAQQGSSLYFLENCLSERSDSLQALPEASGALSPAALLWQTLLQTRGFRCQLKLQDDENKAERGADRATDRKIGLGHDTRTVELLLSGLGSTQLDNLSLALLALLVLERCGCFTDLAGASGGTEPCGLWQLALQGVQNCRLPGRFAAYWLESRQCLLLFDGAHTPLSCQRLLQDLQSYLMLSGVPRNQYKTALLFGAVQGKNFGKMAHILAPHFDQIMLTRAGTFKHNDLNALETAFRQALPAGNPSQCLASISEPDSALQMLLAGRADLVLVCGSLYLLGELLPR